jgi:hypothetical protein
MLFMQQEASGFRASWSEIKHAAHRFVTPRSPGRIAYRPFEKVRPFLSTREAAASVREGSLR